MPKASFLGAQVMLSFQAVLLYTIPLIFMSVAYYFIFNTLWRRHNVPGSEGVGASASAAASGAGGAGPGTPSAAASDVAANANSSSGSGAADQELQQLDPSSYHRRSRFRLHPQGHHLHYNNHSGGGASSNGNSSSHNPLALIRSATVRLTGRGRRARADSDPDRRYDDRAAAASSKAALAGASSVGGKTSPKSNGGGQQQCANRTLDNQLKTRRKVAKMLIAVVIMFAVNFFPVHLLPIINVGIPPGTYF